jgi:hypothetical protein
MSAQIEYWLDLFSKERMLDAALNLERQLETLLT